MNPTTIESAPPREEKAAVAPSHRFSLRAIYHQLCSECGEGKVFRGSFQMNEHCPVCGYKFERGSGYFTGAMYFSYALGIPIIAAALFLGMYVLFPSWPLPLTLLFAWAVFLPFAPAIFRYSRVLFIHFDRYFDPEGE